MSHQAWQKMCSPSSQGSLSLVEIISKMKWHHSHFLSFTRNDYSPSFRANGWDTYCSYKIRETQHMHRGSPVCRSKLCKLKKKISEPDGAGGVINVMQFGGRNTSWHQLRFRTPINIQAKGYQGIELHVVWLKKSYDLSINHLILIVGSDLEDTATTSRSASITTQCGTWGRVGEVKHWVWEQGCFCWKLTWHSGALFITNTGNSFKASLYWTSASSNYLTGKTSLLSLKLFYTSPWLMEKWCLGYQQRGGQKAISCTETDLLPQFCFLFVITDVHHKFSTHGNAFLYTLVEMPQCTTERNYIYFLDMRMEHYIEQNSTYKAWQQIHRKLSGWTARWLARFFLH